MSKAKELLKLSEAVNPKVKQVIDAMLANKDVVHEIPNMIDAAKSAISVGHKLGKPEMVKFNTLSLEMFKALKEGDVEAAYAAADSLVKAGHGAGFGL